MTLASAHPFLVSRGVFFLDLGQGGVQKDGLFSCKVFGIWRQEECICYGLCVHWGSLHGALSDSCVYIWLLFASIQNGDCGYRVYTWGLGVLWCGYTDVVILGCCLFVYILKPGGLVWISDGHMGLGYGTLCGVWCSDKCILGCSLCMYLGVVCVECIP